MPVSPPGPRLPPLTHLAAFEAAGRLGGYAAAAAEGGVTPGAIRTKVRALEQALGAALFTASPQGVALSAVGQRVLDAVQPQFATLHSGLGAWGRNPPLRALPGFEAAVRLGGFTAAAGALGVGSGAVAAQVRRMEAWAGRDLFIRHPRGVSPTAGARAVQPGLARALQGMAAAIALAGVAPVRIAALPAVAQLWLAPRLPALRAALPGVSVSITALERLPEGKQAPYDLALFFAAKGGVVVAQDALVPVFAPSLVGATIGPADLARATRLTDSAWRDDWRDWQKRAAYDHAMPAHGVEHSLYAVAVDEALAGAGVLMGHTALIGRHLDSGALVAPFGKAVPSAKALRLFQLRRGTATAAVAAWLSAQG